MKLDKWVPDLYRAVGIWVLFSIWPGTSFGEVSFGMQEVWLNVGHGPQLDRDHDNDLVGIDVAFARFDRSQQQKLSIGISFTQLESSWDGSSVDALSIYPQLTLLAVERWGVQPFFNVRALGPSWISGSTLGEQRQANHFAFQAQVGAGILFGSKREWFAAISWRHYSNAGLFSPNQSFDVPFVVSVGFRRHLIPQGAIP